MSAHVEFIPVSGIPEVTEGAHLAEAIGTGLTTSGITLGDGDVLVVSSKIASKSLGLVTNSQDKEAVVAAESTYVVAERQLSDRVSRVVRAKAGPIMAAAGVDGSNTGERGGWLLLPHDPDAVCRSLLADLQAQHGVRLGVILSDTAGRPWRVGQTDFCLGAAGLHVVDDLRGGHDADGKPLEVTTRALADEIAAGADLAKGKVSAVPVAVVRGLGHLLLGAAEPGDEPDASDEPSGQSVIRGGRGLVRTGPTDWFGYGRVEAVRASLGIEPGSPESAAVGIPPIGRSTRRESMRRAVAVALHECEDGSADIGRGGITITASSPYELGVLVTRLRAALWCEWLIGTPEPPSADGLSVLMRVSRWRPRL